MYLLVRDKSRVYHKNYCAGCLNGFSVHFLTDRLIKPISLLKIDILCET